MNSRFPVADENLFTAISASMTSVPKRCRAWHRDFHYWMPASRQAMKKEEKRTCHLRSREKMNWIHSIAPQPTSTNRPAHKALAMLPRKKHAHGNLKKSNTLSRMRKNNLWHRHIRRQRCQSMKYANT